MLLFKAKSTMLNNRDAENLNMQNFQVNVPQLSSVLRLLKFIYQLRFGLFIILY